MKIRIGTRGWAFLYLMLIMVAGAPSQGAQLVQSIPEGLESLAQKDLPHTQATWIEMIRGAKSSIDLGQFYVASPPGESLEPVMQELEKAGARGVRIRVLLSNVLLSQDQASYERLKKIPGATVRIYDLRKLTGGIIHCKYWVIDGREIFVGSQNLDWRALTQIHELGLRIQSSALAQQLTQIFEIDWQIAESGQAPPPPPPFPPLPAAPEIELVASPEAFNPPGTRAALPALLELFGQARKSIKFQVMDYSPVEGKNEFWPALDNAVRAAAVRGVEVQIMVSDWNTEAHEIEHLKSLSLLSRVKLKIVSFPQPANRFIPFARVAHSKYMMIDDQILWLGTSNWSKGYFDASRNIELILRNAELAQKGAQIFKTLWDSPYASLIDVSRTYVPPRKE